MYAELVVVVVYMLEEIQVWNRYWYFAVNTGIFFFAMHTSISLAVMEEILAYAIRNLIPVFLCLP